MKKFAAILGFILCYELLHLSCYAQIAKSEDIAQPLTDQMNVEIYTFIGSFLDAQQAADKNIAQQEYQKEVKAIKDSSYKSRIAQMHEGEVSGLLNLLLAKDPHYENITLYTKDGLGVATSGFKNQDLESSIAKQRAPELALGFLTTALLTDKKAHIYTVDKNQYAEKILPIYKSDKGILGTTDSKQSKLIGYFSYILKK